ncbi:MAG: hypothetical protein WDZ37_01100 [Solirubrobacterales bacterium]
MATIELERTLVKSPPELWDELSSAQKLRAWLGDVRVTSTKPPSRLEWDSKGASGVIELEASGWGTKIRAQASTQPSVIARLSNSAKSNREIERQLDGMLDDLGSSSLSGG